MIYAVVGIVVGVLLSRRHTVYAVLLARIPLLGIILAQTWKSGWLIIGLSTLVGCGSLQLGFFGGAFAKLMGKPAAKFTLARTEPPAESPVVARLAAKLARIHPVDLRWSPQQR